MSDGANSNRGQSARERLDELAASLGEHDSTARLATAMAASLDAVEGLVGRHGDKMLAAMETAVATQTDAATAIVARLQDSMLVLGGEFKKLADRLAIAEARIEMLEGRFETRQ